MTPAEYLRYAAVFLAALALLLLGCYGLAWFFDTFVAPLFMTPEEITERQSRRLQEEQSKALELRPRYGQPKRPMRVFRIFNKP